MEFFHLEFSHQLEKAVEMEVAEEMIHLNFMRGFRLETFFQCMIALNFFLQATSFEFQKLYFHANWIEVLSTN